MTEFPRTDMPSILIKVQINGRMLDEVRVPIDEWALPTDDEKIREVALSLDSVVEKLDGREPDRVIVVPGRLVNIIVD